ncbi:ABC transporter substrate-binding protein [Micrococcus sp.]|uniref:ABC transporter substrate-binding protein n=1 Tax=Micrococcus sp. TaxID=1271 RepID=UPI0026DA9FC0|nr:ABC transporter substrate-binding protein [Micrococcus sp.]MDO4238690.1 ABC transporter substrate-binding protein [Micrococcus sp.]
MAPSPSRPGSLPTRLSDAVAPRRRAVLGMFAAAPLLAACGGGDPLSSTSSSPAAGGAASSGEAGGVVRVGSANFAESEILGELYAQILEAQGLQVERKMQIGAREVYIAALQDGSVDVVPEYTGNLLGYFDKEATAKSSGEVASALEGALPEGLTALTPAEAENKDSYNVTAGFSKDNGITSLEDLAGYAGTLRIGGLPELAQREYGAGLSGLTEVYGVPQDKMAFTPISDGGGPLTVRALTDGDVDVANIFSTTPAIQENGFVTLEDPKGMITAQNVVPLMSTGKATDRVRTALDAVQKKLTTDDLLAMNAATMGEEKKQPRQVAADWLREKGLV